MTSVSRPSSLRDCTIYLHSMLYVQGGTAPNQVIARSELEVHHSNLYGVNVSKAVIGAYM